jgi:hypothetical protein
MSLKAKHLVSLEALDSALHYAHEPTVDLFAEIIGGACTRIPLLAKAEAIDHLMHLAKIGAWTEAAFALIELESPHWRVRRLAYENGEWLCSLSRQPNLPMAFDDCAEATHEVLPMAILCAFVEACRRRNAMQCPYRRFLKSSSHGRSTSCAVRIIGDDWGFAITSNFTRA